MPYSEAFPKEKAAAIKAIALDEALPEGHVQLAHAAMNLDWDWATEGKEFKRASSSIQTLPLCVGPTPTIWNRWAASPKQSPSCSWRCNSIPFPVAPS